MIAPRPPAHDERGASAVEHGIILAGVAAAVVLAVSAFGGAVGAMFTETCDEVSVTTGGTAC